MDNKRLLTFIFLTVSVIAGAALYAILAGGVTWDVVVIMLIVVIALVFAVPRFILDRHDKVGKDEFSQKVLRLAAARSFYISLYTWLILSYFSKALDDLIGDTSMKFGLGIMIMAVVFFINAIILKITGIKE